MDKGMEKKRFFQGKLAAAGFLAAGFFAGLFFHLPATQAYAPGKVPEAPAVQGTPFQGFLPGTVNGDVLASQNELELTSRQILEQIEKLAKRSARQFMAHFSNGTPWSLLKACNQSSKTAQVQQSKDGGFQ